ncbi:MAG: PilC/PilY family type IV pilus protein [Pedobacter sp.]
MNTRKKFIMRMVMCLSLLMVGHGLLCDAEAWADKGLDIVFDGNSDGSVRVQVGTVDETIFSDTSYQVANDASVTLTATSGGVSSFSAWTGDVTASNSVVTFSMGNAARAVTASFTSDGAGDPAAEVVVSLTFSGEGSGSVSMSGSLGHSCKLASNGNCLFAAGERITFNANPTLGSEFGEWSGGHSGSEESFAITLTESDSFEVSFTLSTETTVPGCGTSISTNYAGGFNADNFAMNNVSVTDEGYLQLETGDDAIDPNNIIIPFEQEVAVTFLQEGAGYTLSDFGWMLASDGVDGERHPIYDNVEDVGGDGVLKGREGDDTNGDGTVDALDSREVLGTFAAGSELVFYLKVDDDWRKPTYFTKESWNPDTYTGDCTSTPGQTITKTFKLGVRRNTSTDTCSQTGWLESAAITRADDLFDLQFALDDTQTMTLVDGEQYPHVIVGTPGDKPNEWILGWEDLWGGGDTDFNDMVFQIERRTGGVAQLESSQAIEPTDTEAFYTAVEIEVWDNMPCAGQTDIDYYVSIDNGDNWVEVTAWDAVREYTLDADGDKTLGATVEGWSPGTPSYTYRTRRIDFAGLGFSGRQLIWKAVLTSEEETCVPEILDVNLTGAVSTHADISRASPVAQANVLYSGSYETPAIDWDTSALRGHLRAMRTYDPLNTSTTDNVELWDAGEVLAESAPSSRRVVYPNISLTAVSGEELATGDGVTAGFSGTLAHHPVVGESVVITAGTETFTDKHTDVLVGSLGGSGTINRFTGEWKITPNEVLTSGMPVNASYVWYATSSVLQSFTSAGVDNAMLGLDNTFVHGSGYRYDFNKDNAYTEADGDYLVNWVRGYADGVSTPKQWILDPVDHSVPAVVTPPARPAWYYGSDFTESPQRESYDAFVTAQAERDTIVLVGSRSGMLHAFNAGQFRWGDNVQTAEKENRGYFLWDPSTDVMDWWAAFLSDYGDTNPETSAPFFTWQTHGDRDRAPDYGDGKELWAFIPANLLPRLKNNLLQGEDRAFVDASPSVSDVYIGGEWKTVVLCAEGNGGDSVFALDITNPDNPTFLWEFADPDLFRSRSSPAVAILGQIRVGGQSKWVAFFVSGQTIDANLYPSVYVVDIANGQVIERIYLDSLPAGKGGVPSGQPAIVDTDHNGYIDRLYVGTDKGYLYKVNIPDRPDSFAYPISKCVINTDFDYEQVDADGVSTTITVPTAQRYHSIYASPTVVVDNSLTSSGELEYNVRIFFGTGDSPYADEDIDTDNTNYHFFAYTDHAEKGSTSVDNIELSWFETLPAGHRVFASAYAAAGSIYFGTATSDTEDPCAGPNEGRIYAFSYSGSSLLNDASGTHGVEVGDIITTPLVYDEHLYFKTANGLTSLGSGKHNNETKTGGLPYTRLRQWREVF